MKENTKINRRQFLTGLTVTGIMSLISSGRADTAESISINKDNYLETLIKVLKEQAAYHNDVLHQGQIENLTYAFEKICPTNHQEMAFVVACGTNTQPLNHIIDEYARRRKGEKSHLPDHPLMALNEWGLPDTQRILIFREQIEALLKELIDFNSPWIREKGKIFLRGMKDLLRNLSDCHPVHCQILFYMILRKQEGFSYNEFRVLLKKDLKIKYGSELATIYDALQYYAPICRPYAWCSTMVVRASRMFPAFTNRI